jgi:MFS transporter, DHA2 family, multidrug resistance protein
MRPDDPPRATWREWLALALLILPVIMTATDMTVLFLALPSISADLAPGSTQMLWILHIDGFLGVGLALTMGRLAQRFGARRLLLTAVTVYGLASLAAALSVAPEMLIGMRAVMGMAAAALMPSIMVLLRHMFAQPRQFSMAVAVTMTSFSAGMAVGPPLGGVLLEFFWWGAVFLVNVPVAAVVLLATPLLPVVSGEEAGRVDMVSVALSLAAIVAVVFGLQEIADAQASGSGAATWPYLLAIIAGLVLGALFVRRQLRLRDPLLDLRIFATRAFTVSVLAFLLMLLAYGGTDMLLAQYLQTVVGLSPGHAGLLLIAPAVASIITGMLAPAMTRLVRPAFVMAIGLALSAASGGAIALLAGHAGPVTLVALHAVIALALGPMFALLPGLIVGTAPVRHAGPAAAVSDVGGGLGNSLSLAFHGTLVAVVYRLWLDRTAPQDTPEQATRAAGESIGGAEAVAEGLEGAAGRGLLDAAHTSYTLGVQIGYAAGAGLLVVVAVLVAVLLRHASLDTTSSDDEPEGGARAGARLDGAPDGEAEGTHVRADG